jgi:hypothetical protein
MIARMTKFYLAIVGSVLAIGLFLPTSSTLANTTQIKPEIVSLTGTIHKLAIEGTCYQLDTVSGKKYELMGKFPKQDGLKIKVKGIVATDAVSICQVGQIFKVKSYRNIK